PCAAHQTLSYYILVGRAYMVAGACLHTMVLMQAYQADILKDLDEGEGPTPEGLAELRPLHGGYGSHRETFVAKPIGMKDKDRAFLLDAIAVLHAPLDVWPLGRHQLVIRFLRGAWRMRPATRSKVPAWDLAVVLEGLSLAPFEPLESATAKNLTFKMVFLLAITSLKRVGDLQGLAISPTCLEFAPGGVKAILHPRPDYVPKVPSNVARPVDLQAFHPPPHVSTEEERLHLLCLIRVLNIFIQKSSHWRRSEQLLVCFGSPKKGFPASKQMISNWIIQAIALAYQVRGLPSPVALRVHSTRGMASTRALL
ncbi:hypothetical protein M9458_010537, partial [Cirrhinus mrigala]